MSVKTFFKGFFKFFLLCAGANYKRNQQAGRSSYDPYDERCYGRDHAYLSLDEQLLDEGPVNADPERRA